MIRIFPGADFSSNVPSSAIRPGDIPIIIGPNSTGMAVTISVDGSDEAIAGSTTTRPVAVDGLAPTICRSVMSSPVTVSFIAAVSPFGPAGPNDCARSVYSPGARPVTLNVPSGRIGPFAAIEKP